MEPVYYTVESIDGDYAHLISDGGVENQVAMFLLPEGATPPGTPGSGSAPSIH